MDYRKINDWVAQSQEWVNEVSKLKDKYEKEKFECSHVLERLYKKRDFAGLLSKMERIRSITIKDQLVLYNNIQNFSENVLLNNLLTMGNQCKNRPEVFDSLLLICEKILLKEFSKIRNLLVEQAQLFEEHDLMHTESFFYMLERIENLINAEKDILKEVESDIKKIRKHAENAKEEVEKLMDHNLNKIEEMREEIKEFEHAPVQKIREWAEEIGENAKLQMIMSGAIFSSLIVAELCGGPMTWLISIAMGYKIGFRCIPALVGRGDVSESIVEFLKEEGPKELMHLFTP